MKLALIYLGTVCVLCYSNYVFHEGIRRARRVYEAELEPVPAA